MWFGASLCVMVGAMISFVNELFSLVWVDALEMAYLFLFGLLLATVDTPLFSTFNVVNTVRHGVNRFVAILTRVSGKGVVYMFLGCTLWSSMFSNLEGGFLLFLAVLLGVLIFFTGIVSLVLGISKSRNLNLVRLELHKHENVQQMYDSHAKTKPELGLTSEEFNKMSPYLRGVSFEGSDLKFIFNALSSDPSRNFISIHDMRDWVSGGMVFI